MRAISEELSRAYYGRLVLMSSVRLS